MSAPLTLNQLRALARGFDRVADEAEAAGKTGTDLVDLTEASFAEFGVDIDTFQAAVDAARKAQGQGKN